MGTLYVCPSGFLSFQRTQPMSTKFYIGGLSGEFHFGLLWSNLYVHVTHIILDTHSKSSQCENNVVGRTV
jgi:hypothetical protein